MCEKTKKYTCLLCYDYWTTTVIVVAAFFLQYLRYSYSCTLLRFVHIFFSSLALTLRVLCVLFIDDVSQPLISVSFQSSGISCIRYSSAFFVGFLIVRAGCFSLTGFFLFYLFCLLLYFFRNAVTQYRYFIVLSAPLSLRSLKLLWWCKNCQRLHLFAMCTILNTAGDFS